MRDLLASGAITVLPVLGRKKIERRTRRRGAGKVRMRVVDKKEKYIILTRKFRKYLANLRITGKVSEENYQKLRREIRASAFRDMNHFKEAVSER
jgi:ribosomal protein L19E